MAEQGFCILNTQVRKVLAEAHTNARFKAMAQVGMTAGEMATQLVKRDICGMVALDIRHDARSEAFLKGGTVLTPYLSKLKHIAKRHYQGIDRFLFRQAFGKRGIKL